MRGGGPFHAGRSGGVYIGSDHSVEAEEGRSEVGFQPFAGIWLKVQLDIGGKGGTDRREQTGMRMWSISYNDKREDKTHKNQGGVEIPCLDSVSYSTVPAHIRCGNRAEGSS